jgi:thioredoxin-related protein
MKKTTNFLFVLEFLLIIGFFYHSPQKTAVAGDEEKKNPSPVEKTDSLIWYKYDEGLAKAEKEKKHILIAFYTTWCGWCRRMDKFTYTDKDIKEILNESYVAIKVNAQSKEKVKVDGKEITETELARKFGVRSYPTTWFLKNLGEKIAPYYGYADAQSFLPVLNYIKDDLYDEISYEEYLKNKEIGKDSDKEIGK